MVGTKLSGRYQIISQLGSGGFGQTYLAEDRHLPGNPHCVVKHLKPNTTSTSALQTARRLFDTEAEVLYKLGKHDQIPQLFAHFEENEEFYLVQELIEGHSLKEELPTGEKLIEDCVSELLQDILTILEFVHKQGVIHRDIKPANLIRRKDDNKIVLIDFGAVKQVSAQTVNEQGETSLTIAIGSPGYMPNEQLAGTPRFSSDIYAVGIMGIQALTGIHPKQIRPDPKTSEIIWRNQIEVSPGLAYILDKMVRYDFRQRYLTATSVLADINNLSSYTSGMCSCTSLKKSSTSQTSTLSGKKITASQTSTLSGKKITASQTSTLSGGKRSTSQTSTFSGGKRSTSQTSTFSERKSITQTSSLDRKDLTQTSAKVTVNSSRTHKQVEPSTPKTISFQSVSKRRSPVRFICVYLLKKLKTNWFGFVGVLMLAFLANQIRSFLTQSPSSPTQVVVNVVNAATSPSTQGNHATPSVQIENVQNQLDVLTSHLGSQAQQLQTMVSQPTPSAQIQNVQDQIAGLTRQFEESQAQQLLAKGIMVSINRAQQFFYVQNKRFASKWEELQLNVNSKNENYDYAIVRVEGERTIVTATAKKPGLKSYTGAVIVSGEWSYGKVCETNEPSNTPPRNPEFVGKDIKCPSGSS